jgi:hypothetical protein
VGGRFDCGADEGRVQDDGFHVGVEAYCAVDLSFDVLVKIVETGFVRQPTQLRQDGLVTEVLRLAS